MACIYTLIYEPHAPIHHMRTTKDYYDFALWAIFDESLMHMSVHKRSME